MESKWFMKCEKWEWNLGNRKDDNQQRSLFWQNSPPLKILTRGLGPERSWNRSSIFLNSEVVHNAAQIQTTTMSPPLRMPEKLCLQWNDFKENVNSAFGKLRGDKEFTDVTLVCEQRPKNLGGRVALPSGKFLRVTLKIALRSFRTLWKISR